MILVAIGAALAALIFVLMTRLLAANQSRTPLTIGIGPFPDALPILVGAERGYFPEFDIKIKILNWAQANEALLDGRCDVLFGPKHFMIAGAQSPEGGGIEVGATLGFYQGFGILVSPLASDIATYADFRNRGLSQRSATVAALAQLADRRVYCMSIDAVAALSRMLGHYSIAGPEIVPVANTEQAFEQFRASHPDEPSFFVGGVTHRLLAHHLSIRCLISELEQDFSTTEHLAFMTRALSGVNRVALEQAWFRCIRHMHRDQSFKEQLAELMNQVIGRLYGGAKFSVRDVTKVMYEYEHFPESEADASVLAEKLRDQGVAWAIEIEEARSIQRSRWEIPAA